MHDDRPLVRVGQCAAAAAIAIFLSFGAVALASSDARALTDVQRLRAEVHTLKAQVLEARYQLATCQVQQQATTLARERQALEAEFRDVLAPPNGATFDWTTLTFASPPAEKTP